MTRASEPSVSHVSKIICSQSRPTLPRAGVGRKPTSLCGGASASLKTIVRSPPPDCVFILLALSQQQPHRLYGNHQQRHGDNGHSDRARDHKQKLQAGWYPHPLDNPAIVQKCPLGFAETVIPSANSSRTPPLRRRALTHSDERGAFLRNEGARGVRSRKPQVRQRRQPGVHPMQSFHGVP
jgi:hypothetical protein